MTDLKTVYSQDRASEEFLKSQSQASYADYAARVIMSLFGNPTYTTFELYQAIHKALPHLEHIVYNRKTKHYKFIFNDAVDITIEIHVQTTPPEEIDLPAHWDSASFVDIPEVWDGKTPVHDVVVSQDFSQGTTVEEKK